MKIEGGQNKFLFTEHKESICDTAKCQNTFMLLLTKLKPNNSCYNTGIPGDKNEFSFTKEEERNCDNT